MHKEAREEKVVIGFINKKICIFVVILNKQKYTTFETKRNKIGQ